MTRRQKRLECVVQSSLLLQIWQVDARTYQCFT
jgi:hypothetical protein